MRFYKISTRKCLLIEIDELCWLIKDFINDIIFLDNYNNLEPISNEPLLKNSRQNKRKVIFITFLRGDSKVYLIDFVRYQSRRCISSNWPIITEVTNSIVYPINGARYQRKLLHVSFCCWKTIKWEK